MVQRFDRAEIRQFFRNEREVGIDKVAKRRAALLAFFGVESVRDLTGKRINDSGKVYEIVAVIEDRSSGYINFELAEVKPDGQLKARTESCSLLAEKFAFLDNAK